MNLLPPFYFQRCCKFVDFKEITLTHSFQNHYIKQVKHPPQDFPY